MRHLGRVRVSYEMLESLLPPGSRILRTYDDPEYSQSFFVLIEGPACPEIREGEAVPWINA